MSGQGRGVCSWGLEWGANGILAHSKLQLLDAVCMHANSCPPARRCRYAEMGSSASILRAGYNIDSLMARYQGVDWRQTENWGCNAA